MGSVAERIVRHCDCSALVLRRTNEAEPVPAPPVGWFPRKSVVVPIDFSEASSTAIETALEVATNRKSVHVVSVVPTLDLSELADMGIISDEDRIRTCREYMSRYLTEHGHESLRTHAFVGDPGTMIIKYASNALDQALSLPAGETKSQLLTAMEKHILAEGQLIGIYER